MQEAPKPTRANLWRLLSLAAPYRKAYYWAIFLTLLISALAAGRPMLVQYAVDGPIAAGHLSELNLLMLGLLGLLMLETGVTYAQTRLTNSLAQNIMDRLRVRVFGHLLRQSPEYYDHTPVGTLQTRTISDIETLNNVFSSSIVTIVGQLLQMLAILVAMFWYDWRLTLVVLITVPLFVVATRIFQMRVREAFNRVRRYVAEQNAFLQEHITGLLVTQLFNREAEEQRRFEEVNRKQMKANLDAVLYYSVFFPVIEILSSLALALLVWYGAGQVVQQQLSFGVLVGFTLYTNMLLRPIRLIGERFNDLQLGVVSAERLFKVLDTKERVTYPPANPTDAYLVAPEGIEVAFRDVEFAYKAGFPVLNGLSFTVPAGTTTAIVGATGSGKTTIMSLLLRFYEPQQGQVLLNGQMLQHFSAGALYAHVGLMQQDVFLFSGSIMENITLKQPGIGRARVEEAARAVGADRFIDQLPGGYDYVVGERGLSLSTGQRQLLAFVRVMVHNPRLLLLDEATASVDTETELLVQQAIRTVLKGRTAVIVAHRLSTIQHADQILVLHKGELVERGTHSSLLAAGGHYTKLYRHQYGLAEAV